MVYRKACTSHTARQVVRLKPKPWGAGNNLLPQKNLRTVCNILVEYMARPSSSSESVNNMSAKFTRVLNHKHGKRPHIRHSGKDTHISLPVQRWNENAN